MDTEHQPPQAPVDLRAQLRSMLDLAADQAEPAAVDQAIRAGVTFRGTNLWLLVFAIVIASVGLNVNSPAVIIGAMLISPLMGPIMGVGYGVAVADLRLVRGALLNLLIATAASLTASAAYFSISPLSQAHSELLARTGPTVWDVLIALFGGLAGTIGATRRERSNVVPGVAIATALMPPLCTAGYGLAIQNYAYFAGAFYLFFINSVFIAAATFLMIRVMQLPEITYQDAAASRRAHRWLALVVIATALPSVLLARQLVATEVFESRATAFLEAAFPSGAPALLVGREIDAGSRRIGIAVVGGQITPDHRRALEGLLLTFGLEGTTLQIDQAEQPEIDVEALRRDIAGELHQRAIAALRDRDAAIDQLEAELAEARAGAALSAALEAEILAQYPEIGDVVVAVAQDGAQRALLVGLGERRPLAPEHDARLRAWLAVRAGVSQVWLFKEPGLARAGTPEPPR